MNGLTNIQSAVEEAAQFVQATWQQAVMGTVTIPGALPVKVNMALRQLYADSIVTSKQIVGMGNVSQRIIAAKKIAEQLENGTGPWDMKPMLLNGPKARYGKNGKYNIIPFQHGTPGTTSIPAMPKNVYSKARELKASVKQGNAVKWGGKLPAQGKPGHNPTSGYQHKNDKYEGMVKIQHTYAKATQSKYMTFRVVSENSPATSWIHPGYQAHHIAQGVAEFCRPAVESMIQQAAEADLQQAIVNIGLR